MIWLRGLPRVLLPTPWSPHYAKATEQWLSWSHLHRTNSLLCIWKVEPKSKSEGVKDKQVAKVYFVRFGRQNETFLVQNDGRFMMVHNNMALSTRWMYIHDNPWHQPGWTYQNWCCLKILRCPVHIFLDYRKATMGQRWRLNPWKGITSASPPPMDVPIVPVAPNIPIVQIELNFAPFLQHLLR